MHEFAGHVVPRPVLVFDGRECGRSRLTITRRTSPSDWSVANAERVHVNGQSASASVLQELLTTQHSSVVDVVLTNGQLLREFQFEFALSEEHDLLGVDAALDRLIASSELSARAIDDFIMRSKQYTTAAKYLAGLADYLYGVLAREALLEGDEPRSDGYYQGKYDQAVLTLSNFDRPAAEAVCGIVALHYNQFGRAMSRTRSRRVAEVALRLEGMLSLEAWPRSSLLECAHGSLDVALSDSVMEQVLTWCAMPLDGSAAGTYEELVRSIPSQRASDAFKLHLLASEHAWAAGASATARSHAEHLRHTRVAEKWYADMRHRCEGPESA